MRTMLTILGVSVGIGTVLFLVSLGYGLQRIVLSKITTADSLLSLDVASSATGLIKLDQKSAEKISQIPEVAETSPLIGLSGQLARDKFIGDYMVYAAPTSFFRLEGTQVNTGTLFKKNDAYEAVISSAGARLLNLEPDQIINQKVSLILFIPHITEEIEEIKIEERKEQFNIVGVINDENNSFVFIPQDTIRELDIDDYAKIKVKVKDSKFMEKVRQEIIEQGFLVSALSDTIEQVNKIFKIVRFILAFFGLIAIIVSAIGMFNTMTVALLERINEVGIMRAIGVARKDIKRLFLVESIVMGFLGGLGGIAVGYLACQAANLGFNILAKSFGGQNFNLFYQPPWFMLVIVVFSSLVGFLTGIYPAKRASKLNPLEALRYK